MSKKAQGKKRVNRIWNHLHAMDELRKKCYTDVLENFDKYSAENKLRISIVIFGKDFTPRPQEVQPGKGLTIQLVNFDTVKPADSRIEVHRFDTLAPA